MHDIMVHPLPVGCRLTAIFDCCHSGSALSLPYEYVATPVATTNNQGVNGLLKEPNILHEAGRGLLHALESYQQGDMETALLKATSLIKTVTRTKEKKESVRKTRTSPADVIQLSGCKNYEKSADTKVDVFPPSSSCNVRVGKLAQ
jgi:metacaspase-1